jgi:TetR/AcrR family fatty acid metabolism transcriptional regulator
MPRVVDREARRAELVSAAAAVFAERGLAAATISDIVAAAGVAQGTFYLYFDSKDDVVLAVAERFGDRMLAGIEQAVAASHDSAVSKLLALRDVLGDAAALRSATDLVVSLHDPKNAAIHDRLTEHLAPRLVAVGGLRSVELSQVPQPGLPAALEAATTLALRALGHAEPAQ